MKAWLMSLGRIMRSRALAIAIAACLGVALACGLPTAAPTSEPVVPTATEPPAPTPTEVPSEESPPAPTATPDLRNLVLVAPGGTIRIAYQGPETGPDYVNPDLGPNLAPHPFLQAVQKGVEDFGPVHGFPVELISFDDDCEPGEGTSAAGDVVSDPQVVAVVGPACSPSAVEALPTYEIALIPVVSGSATQTKLVPYGPSVFNRVILNDDQMQQLGFILAVDTEALPSVQQFHAEYQAWGGAPLVEGPNSYLPYHYDAAGLLLTAIEQTAVVLGDGSLEVDRDLLLSNIRATVNYSGVTGSISITVTGDRAP